MTKNIGFINTASQNWANVVGLVNTISQVLSNEIVTANNGPGGGAMSAGNGFVSGIFGANTVVATTIQGGNVTNISVLTLGSNLNSNGNIITTGNVTLNSTSVTISGEVTSGINITTTGTSAQVVDSFLLNTYRSGKYLIQVTDNVNNNYQFSEVLLIQSTGNSYLTEYGIIVSNTAIGGFTSSVNATAAILNFTPVSSNTTVKGQKTLLPL